MTIDLPQCDLQQCRFCSNHRCRAQDDVRDRCEYASLRAQQQENKPLTLEELREESLKRSAIWCVDTDGVNVGVLCYAECALTDGKEAHIWLLDNEGYAGMYNVRYMLGACAKFYRQKPEVQDG